MIFIVYAESKKNTIGASLGSADYSYYFVLRQFVPMLKTLGTVVEVNTVTPYVDCIYRVARSMGQKCIFLSFTPPHKTISGLSCPTVPVFAWEFSTLPNESWDDNEKNNWVAELVKYEAAITHSDHTCRVTKSALTLDFPIVSIPAPLWDRFSQLYQNESEPYLQEVESLAIQGWVIDSRYMHPAEPASRIDKALHSVELTGVVYTSVLNPNDERKNWKDLLRTFCWAFRDTPDATLLLKLTYGDDSFIFGAIYSEIQKLLPFSCRVVLMQGYLEACDYEKLISCTSFSLNASAGEGQCLPLMEFMSAGKPAIAPAHTGMEGYVNANNSFLVDTTEEWTCWPQDLRRLFKTFWHRVNCESLCSAYLASYEEAKSDKEAYWARASMATKDLRLHCSQDVARKGISVTLENLSFKPRGVVSVLALPIFFVVFKPVVALLALVAFLEPKVKRVFRFARRKISGYLA